MNASSEPLRRIAVTDLKAGSVLNTPVYDERGNVVLEPGLALSEFYLDLLRTRNGDLYVSAAEAAEVTTAPSRARHDPASDLRRVFAGHHEDMRMMALFAASAGHLRERAGLTAGQGGADDLVVGADLPREVPPAEPLDVDPDTLHKLVNRVESLPTLPSTLTRLNAMLTNPDTGAGEVAQVISTDPTLSARVMKVVNSAFYGFPKEIESVTHAVVVLGFNTVRHLVWTTAVFDTFSGEGHVGFDRGAFWRHSVAVGAAARTLADVNKSHSSEVYFLAGLLHDLGKVVLDECFPAEFRRVLERTALRDCLMLEAEQEVLQVTHADIGAWLGESWGLPPAVLTAVRHHHRPDQAETEPEMAAVIHVADILVRSLRLGSGGDMRIPAIHDTAWEMTGLSVDDFPDLLQRVEDEMEKAVIFLEMAAAHGNHGALAGDDEPVAADTGDDDADGDSTSAGAPAGD